MIKNLQRRDAIKTMVAVGGLFLLRGTSMAENVNEGEQLANGWLYQGQPCVIYQRGSILLFINERGSVGSGVWTSDTTFVVLGGTGWDAGLTAEVSNHKKIITWSNNTVWTRGPAPNRVLNLPGSWLYQGQPCAIFQQDALLLLVNELGSIGTGLWTVNNSFVVIGGNGWDLGLTAQVTNNKKTINWSNGTSWSRSSSSGSGI